MDSADILLLVGSIVVVVWGVAHIAPTKSVVRGFGAITEDNRRIITMEWVAEGLTLCFIGVIVLAVTFLDSSENPVSEIVIRLSAVMLVIMAVLTQLTGARTSVLAIKLCPVVKTVVAVTFIIGTVA